MLIIGPAPMAMPRYFRHRAAAAARHAGWHPTRRTLHALDDDSCFRDGDGRVRLACRCGGTDAADGTAESGESRASGDARRHRRPARGNRQDQPRTRRSHAADGNGTAAAAGDARRRRRIAYTRERGARTSGRFRQRNCGNALACRGAHRAARGGPRRRAYRPGFSRRQPGRRIAVASIPRVRGADLRGHGRRSDGQRGLLRAERRQHRHVRADLENRLRRRIRPHGVDAPFRRRGQTGAAQDLDDRRRSRFPR